jgi:iron complex outermembrane recepter protein
VPTQIPTARRTPLRAGAAVTLLALSVAVAVAEEPGVAPAESLEAVTVFGSRLKSRTVFDSAVPIDNFSPAEVERALSSGELGQALQSLSPSINMPRASSSGTSDSVRAIQLRGLAPDQVLVLVNGKRRHTNAVMDQEGLFPGTVAVDLNAIPPGAIDHIEVLRDGAGAMYGSDAIAGVVNIVLKSGVGGSASAGFGENRTHFAPTGATVTDGQNRTLGFDEGFAIGEHGSFHFGADYQKRDATNRAGPSSAGWTSYNSTPADLALDNQVLFKSGDPDLENKNIFYNATLPLGSGPELYSFSTFDSRSTKGGAFFRYPGDPNNVPSIYPNGFRPVSTGDSKDFALVAGARGHAGSWDLDLSASEGYNTFSYGLTNSLNVSLGAASPTSFHVADFTYDQKAVNLDATTHLVTASHVPVNVAVGAELIAEKYHTSPGDPASYAAGPVTSAPPGSQGDNGLRPQDAVDLSRHVWSAYVDSDAELTEALLVGAAARYSKYSDYGSSTTGKLTARFKFTEAFLVRGALSSSFRAPALAQTGIRFATLNFNADGSGLQNNAWLPPGDPLAQQFGAVSLKPERSVNATLGLAYRLSRRTSATLDLYQIRIRDRITPSGQLDATLVQPYLDTHGITDVASVQFLTNALDTTNRGLDLVLSHDQDLAGGVLRLTASFNRNYAHQDGVRDTNPALSALDPTATLTSPSVLVPLEYGSPGSKLVLATDWSNALWGAHLDATRYGRMYSFSYDLAEPPLLGANAHPYDPAWSIDLEGHVNVGKDVTLALGGTNIFNRYPDRITSLDGSYGGAFPYNYANPLGINGAYFYGRVTVRFGH